MRFPSTCIVLSPATCSSAFLPHAGDHVLLDDVHPAPDHPEPLVSTVQERVVALHHLVEVALGVDVDLLAPSLVLERELVAAATPRRGLRPDAAARPVAREREGRRVRAVVHRPQHHRLVGITALEDHDHLHADGGDKPNISSNVRFAW
jgi:hypothetical protein